MAELVLGGRWLLGLVLVVAGAAKLVSDLDRRADAVANYRVLPAVLVRPAARLLPVIEVLAGVLLLAGVAVVIAAGVAAAMLAGFSLAVAWNLAGGRQFDCGCGAADGGRSISWSLVASDLLLAAVAAGVILGPSRGLALWAGPGAGGAVAPASQFLPVPMLVIIAFLAVRFLGRQRGLLRSGLAFGLEAGVA